MHVKAILTLVMVAAMVAPSGAPAQKPPDNGAIDQYAEGLPGADGETPSGEAGAGKGGAGKGTLGEETAGALAGKGSGGAVAAALAQSTAPDSRTLREAARRAQAGKSIDSVVRDSAGESTGGSTPTAVFDAVVTGSGEGMGVALPILLASALLGAIALPLNRRRRDAGRTPD